MVIGLRMVPFTVGHAILLHRLGSPFVTGGRASANDLVEAVVVCSQSAEESIKTMASVFRWLPLRLMRKKVSKSDIVKECHTLQEWIGDKSDCPEVLRQPGSVSREAAMPWPERLLVSLVDIGFTEETVLNMPVTDAERFFLTNAEMHGQVELWNDKNDALWRLGKERETVRN
jgi:hypothetical protein